MDCRHRYSIRPTSYTLSTSIARENLLCSWQEFVRGKRKRRDVQEFALKLPDYVYELYSTLFEKTYRHGSYEHFKISDPKPRDIHKATVRDRLVHHAVYRILYPFFQRTFIADSFSLFISNYLCTPTRSSSKHSLQALISWDGCIFPTIGYYELQPTGGWCGG